MPTLSIGCSGFNYKHWKGTFYPAGLPQRKWLDYYFQVFSTVELNVTFYRLPGAGAFEKWRGETPPGFAFAVKGSRYITHLKRLLEPEQPLALFFERALLLKEKLKVVLWQFPPGFRAHVERLQNFLELLKQYPVRNTFEFRNESWITGEVISLCRESNVSLCTADAPAFNFNLPAVADFVYIRRHGAMGIDGDYTREFIEQDAIRIREHLNDGRDVFVYFNNDAYGFAPKNARMLTEAMHMEPVR
ncbi:MAG TPA: DUF72 domain-containing protein [Dissulfurispiraceae bacterium]